MRVAERIEISAPPEAVWKLVGDTRRYLHFMPGVTRWEAIGDRPDGVGARYRMLLRVGPTDVGGEIEIVEWTEPRDIAWTSVLGIDQRGRWRLRERADADGNVHTRVELRLSYGVAGSGLFGWLAEQLSAPSVRGHLRGSLRQLKREVEYEQLRAEAARRRAAGGAGGAADADAEADAGRDVDAGEPAGAAARLASPRNGRGGATRPARPRTQRRPRRDRRSPSPPPS